MKRYRLWLYQRQQKREQNLLKEQQSQTFRSNAIVGGQNRIPGGKSFSLRQSRKRSQLFLGESRFIDIALDPKFHAL